MESQENQKTKTKNQEVEVLNMNKMNIPFVPPKSLGWSKFALDRHVEGSGNSFFRCRADAVLERTKAAWAFAKPGQGETGLDRKIVVPIQPDGFFMSLCALQENLPIKARVAYRQPGEDPYVEIYVTAEDAKAFGVEYEPAKFVNIVCYSAEALLENGGERATDCEWEIVAVLASKVETEPMGPLTMARNFLEKPGGTKSVYTAQEFAEAIYNNSQRGIKIRDQK